MYVHSVHVCVCLSVFVDGSHFMSWMLHGSLCLLSQSLARLMETAILLGMY